MGKCILLCDDDPDILEVIEITLTTNGYNCIKCTNTQQAFDILESHDVPIDCLILDYMMPGENGIQFCKRVKADPRFKTIPIIMLTGKAETTDKIDGYEAGADDYITKPFNPMELVTRINSILRRTEAILDTNPLTHLPGNNTIYEQINQRIQKGQTFGIAYIDLDNFKAYNDTYGFEAGDKLIINTAQILLNIGAENANDIFVGHIGGDDFVIITPADKLDIVCNNIVSAFEAEKPKFYDADTFKRGFVNAKDRQGNISQIPIVSISIAGLSNERRTFEHIAEISQVAAEVKKKAKSIQGSAYVRDMRNG